MPRSADGSPRRSRSRDRETLGDTEEPGAVANFFSNLGQSVKNVAEGTRFARGESSVDQTPTRLVPRFHLFLHFNPEQSYENPGFSKTLQKPALWDHAQTKERKQVYIALVVPLNVFRSTSSPSSGKRLWSI